MKRIYFCCFIFSLIISIYAENIGTPFFYDDRIIFPVNDESVIVKPLTQLKEDYTVNDLTPFTVEDSFEIIIEYKRVIIIRCWAYSNFGEYEGSFYDFNGNLLNKTARITGSIDMIILQKSGRILLSQQALLTSANDSYLFDFDGNLIKLIFHDYETMLVDNSINEDYIWFISYRMRKAREGDILLYPSFPWVPYNYVMVFDTKSGKLIKEMDIEDSGKFNMMINDQLIEIQLPIADIPG